MLDVITIGGATRDIFFELEQLSRKTIGEEDYLLVPYGEKLKASSTFYSYGGGAVNVAVCQARLGLKTAAYCAVGCEGTGSMIVDYLEKENVGTKFIERDNKTHTGLSVFVLGKDNEHTGFLERGANNDLVFSGFGKFRKTDWVYISSLTGGAEKELPKIFNEATKKKINIAFNPGAAQLKKGIKELAKYLENTNILILNKAEAETLLKKQGDLNFLLRELAKYGPEVVVVTDSERGSGAIYEGRIYKQAALAQEVVDTTGAGDAFGGTFVFGYIKGFEIPYCLKIAALNASSVVGKMGSGAGLLRYRNIKELAWR